MVRVYSLKTLKRIPLKWRLHMWGSALSFCIFWIHNHTFLSQVFRMELAVGVQWRFLVTWNSLVVVNCVGGRGPNQFLKRVPGVCFATQGWDASPQVHLLNRQAWRACKLEELESLKDMQISSSMGEFQGHRTCKHLLQWWKRRFMTSLRWSFMRRSFIFHTHNHLHTVTTLQMPVS